MEGIVRCNVKIVHPWRLLARVLGEWVGRYEGAKGIEVEVEIGIWAGEGKKIVVVVLLGVVGLVSVVEKLSA